MKRLFARLLPFLFAAGFLAVPQNHAPDAGALLPDKTLERELAGGQSHEYYLHLESGQYAKLNLLQRSVNVSVTCLGPDGVKRFEVDSHSVGDTEIPELIADQSGTYRFVVTAPDPHALPGRYNVSIAVVEAATDIHRSRIAAARAYAEGQAAYKPLVREALLKSISRFDEASKHWRAANDPSEESRTLSDMGMLYIQLGDRQKAMDCANQALSIARADRNRRMEAAAISTLGVVYNNFGDKKTAIEYFVQALVIMHDVHDRAGEANTLNYLGRAYFRSGQNRQALPYLEEALAGAREIQDRVMEAYILGDLGSVYDILGEYQRSLATHEQELAIERQLEDHGAEAVALNNLGIAYLGLGEYQKALDSYTASADLNRRLNPRGDRLAVSLLNIGRVYYRLGDRRRALPFYQQALDLLRVIQAQSSLALTLGAMGTVYGELGDSEKAIQLHTEALALQRSANDADGEAESLGSIGREYGKLGEWDKARENDERAVALFRKSGFQTGLAGALRSLGNLYRQTGGRARAMACLEEALAISRTIRDQHGEANTLAGLARLEWDNGNLNRARARTDEALAAFESLRRTIISPNLRASLFASVHEVQELAMAILMRLDAQRPGEGFAASALLASERGRARSLLELLQESGTGIRQGVDPSLIDREQELERLISAKADAQVRLLSRKHAAGEADAIAKDLMALTVELDQVQSRIRSTSPQYAALTQPVPLDLKEIQARVLDPDTVLLEYAMGKEKSFLWTVGSSTVDTFELPPREEVESAVRRVHELLTARNQNPQKETVSERAARLRHADEAWVGAATRVSRMLLGPAASRIEKKRLLIVGEGMLQYLPFAVLPEPRADGKVPSNAVPLIANHEIVTAPSASVVSVLRQQSANRLPAPKTLAVFADPVFGADDPRVAQQKRTAAASSARDNPAARVRRSDLDLGDQDFSRLRFSRTEAEEISRLASPGAIFKALDFDANREAVLRPELAQYRIVHFATHSLINSEHPELSGVVVSLVDRSGHPRNGFLRLYDIYNLHLGADLVVLSACRTALGREVNGEGLIGLTRGFLYAGAPRVVATLWEIDDRTTAEFMKRFYQRMFVRGERPAEALRGAQGEMWKTRGWDAPYYWAAFTLLGEWR